MTGSLKDQTVLVIGRGSGLARAIALAAQDAGAQVIAAGRDPGALAAAYAGEPGISTETVDLTDEASIAALGERLGTLDHVVSTASARARATQAGKPAPMDLPCLRTGHRLDGQRWGPSTRPAPTAASTHGRPEPPVSRPAARTGQPLVQCPRAIHSCR